MNTAKKLVMSASVELDSARCAHRASSKCLAHVVVPFEYGKSHHSQKSRDNTAGSDELFSHDRCQPHLKHRRNAKVTGNWNEFYRNWAINLVHYVRLEGVVLV